MSTLPSALAYHVQASLFGAVCGARPTACVFYVWFSFLCVDARIAFVLFWKRRLLCVKTRARLSARAEVAAACAYCARVRLAGHLTRSDGVALAQFAQHESIGDFSFAQYSHFPLECTNTWHEQLQDASFSPGCIALPAARIVMPAARVARHAARGGGGRCALLVCKTNACGRRHAIAVQHASVEFCDTRHLSVVIALELLHICAALDVVSRALLYSTPAPAWEFETGSRACDIDCKILSFEFRLELFVKPRWMGTVRVSFHCSLTGIDHIRYRSINCKAGPGYLMSQCAVGLI